MKQLLVNNKKIFFYIIFIYLISAINNPLSFPEITNLKDLIVFFRGTAPIILLPFLVLYLIKNYKKIKIDTINKLFFLYLVFQIPYFFYYDFITIYELYWVLCGLSTLFLFIIFSNEEHNYRKNIYKLFVFIILIISTKFTYDLYSDYIVNYLDIPDARSSFYGWNTMAPNRIFFEQPVPRSSGLARMLMFLWIFSFILYLKFNSKKLVSLTIYLILFFLNFTMFHLESRLIFLMQISLIIFLIFFKIYNLSFKKKIVLISTFILPFFLHFIEADIRKYIKDKNKIEPKKIEIVEKMDEALILNKQILNKQPEKKSLVKIQDKIQDRRIVHSHSSGRLELWNKTLQIVKENYFLGFGPQADRIILNQNVSGIFFYALITGGALSFVSLISMMLLILIRIIKKIFKEKIFLKPNIYFTGAILMMGFLFIRSIGEITFGIYGIDMIFFFIALSLLNESFARDT